MNRVCKDIDNIFVFEFLYENNVFPQNNTNRGENIKFLIAGAYSTLYAKNLAMLHV